MVVLVSSCGNSEQQTTNTNIGTDTVSIDTATICTDLAEHLEAAIINGTMYVQAGYRDSALQHLNAQNAGEGLYYVELRSEDGQNMQKDTFSVVEVETIAEIIAMSIEPLVDTTGNMETMAARSSSSLRVNILRDHKCSCLPITWREISCTRVGAFSHGTYTRGGDCVPRRFARCSELWGPVLKVTRNRGTRCNPTAPVIHTENGWYCTNA